jgi:hypothetical protein
MLKSFDVRSLQRMSACDTITIVSMYLLVLVVAIGLIILATEKEVK